jgi:hypothetical protein
MQVILMKVKSDPSQLAALSQIGTVETSSAGFVKNSGDGGFTGSALDLGAVKSENLSRPRELLRTPEP